MICGPVVESAYEDPCLSPVPDEPGNSHWTEYGVLTKNTHRTSHVPLIFHSRDTIFFAQFNGHLNLAIAGLYFRDVQNS